MPHESLGSLHWRLATDRLAEHDVRRDRCQLLYAVPVNLLSPYSGWLAAQSGQT
jgi:hypothetical protein